MLTHADDGFRIGTKLFALGSMSPDLRRLRASAMPYLHQLVDLTGWATNLAVASDQRVLIVEEVFGAQAGSMQRMVGARLPLHATAIGKALLSGYDERQLDALVGSRLLRPYTADHGRSAQPPADQLEAIRETGVAFSHEEWSRGTSGVASPVMVNGVVVAAIAVVGPPGEAGLRQRAQFVRSAARRLGNALNPAPSVVAAA